MSAAPVSVPRELYPPLEPYETGFLDVSDGHRIYFELSGNPHGKPVVFLHGGPGSGTSPKQRRFFDPAAYKIILTDQRGSGKSTPFASLEHNDTWALVADLERLRVSLGVEAWSVFGGSWGSTLALAYAQEHPARCTSLVLRGIFMIRKEEIDFFYQEGASWLFPDAWEEYLAPIPPEERGDLVAAYYKRLTSADSAVRAEACRAWSVWEGTTSKLLVDEELVDSFGGPMAESLARIECHYFTHGGFFDEKTRILHPDRIARIAAIPTVIVQGRYDLVCPMKSAWDLHKALPHAKFVVVADSGHSAFDVGNQRALLDATDSFRG